MIKTPYNRNVQMHLHARPVVVITSTPMLAPGFSEGKSPGDRSFSTPLSIKAPPEHVRKHREMVQAYFSVQHQLVSYTAKPSPEQT